MAVHIRANHSDFLVARGRYVSALDEMRDLHNTQHNLLNNLADNYWRGDGAAAFRTAISDLTRQTLQGIFMIQSMQNQVGGAHRVFRQADADIAHSFRNFA